MELKSSNDIMILSKQSNNLKYQSVIDSLEKDIFEGKYALGQRIPTQKMLTERFGVSRPTVDKALEFLENKGLVQRRRGSGTFVCKNISNLEQKVKLAFIANRPPREYDFESNFVQLLSSSFSVEAKKRNFSILNDTAIIANGDELFSHCLHTCKEAIDAGIKGAFILPIDFAGDNASINNAMARAFQLADIPVVLLDRDIFKTPQRSCFDVVGINNTRAAFSVTQHLITYGAQELFFVTCNLAQSNTVIDRISGFKAALEQNNMLCDNCVLSGFNYNDTPLRQERLKKLIDGSKKSLGFVCLNDQTAAVLVNDLLKLGLKVPLDARVVGFDDLPSSSLLYSPLTTIRQNIQAIVHTAVDIMYSRFDNLSLPARDIYIAEELVVRDSCGANGFSEV